MASGESILRRIMEGRSHHLEAFAAAYLSLTDIPPEEAVLVEQRDGNIIRWWFERKETHDH
jgi:hypothetical protein